MNIILFTHPPFLGSQSMPRFANMLAEGLKKDYTVEVWTAEAKFYNLSKHSFLKKWLGYIDQYLIFPSQVKKRLKRLKEDTLFVFTDHALGPWVPLVKNYPHVIHCHDFLAQRSALDEIGENPIGWTGKQYQSFIRRGYQKGSNFISVSNKTREDLHQFLTSTPLLSEVVYNGMNKEIKRIDCLVARNKLSKEIGVDTSNGYILHVGGNQWYKNREGVIAIYDAWRSNTNQTIPLIMIGAEPGKSLLQAKQISPFNDSIFLLTGVSDNTLQLAYAGASVFLFPSLAEGFGWPIAEAMALGCPVITTGEAPMTEVGGNAAFYIEKMPFNKDDVKEWSAKAAEKMSAVLNLDTTQKQAIIQRGFDNVIKFESRFFIENIKRIYTIVWNNYSTKKDEVS